MQVTITIVADSMAEAMAALGGSAATPTPTPAKVEKAAPPKNTASTKTEAKEEPKANAEAAPTLDKDVVPLITRVAGMPGGGESLKSLLSEFGVERAGQLEAARYPELIGRLQDILG